jgi:plastocyanin
MTSSTARRVILVLGAAILATVLAAAPVGARTAAATATVTVTEKDFSIKLSAGSVSHGAVTFRVRNVGAVPHDFKIAGKKTATLKAGKSAVLTVRFAKAGRYPFSCSLAGHAAMGMKGVLIVH